jgi:hypothetical protein
MVGVALKGAYAGAASLGILIAILGGASKTLVLVFWGFGTAAVLVHGYVQRRLERRRAAHEAELASEPLADVHAEAVRRTVKERQRTAEGSPATAGL